MDRWAAGNADYEQRQSGDLDEQADQGLRGGFQATLDETEDPDGAGRGEAGPARRRRVSLRDSEGSYAIGPGGA